MTFHKIERRSIRIGMIVPGKIVPVVFAISVHGLAEGHGDEFATRAPRERFDARGISGPGRSQRPLSRLDRARRGRGQRDGPRSTRSSITSRSLRIDQRAGAPLIRGTGSRVAASAITGEGRKRALANGVKFGRKRKLSDYQRSEAIKRRDASETLAANR